jgi:DcuC family C4-dicarboxylate transporter
MTQEIGWSLGGLIIAAAVVAIAKQVDVRLVLTLAGLALGVLAGRPDVIVETFFSTFTNEQFVVPICTAMGFAYVLKQTECDQHLVHLLVRPLERARALLIPGAVVVGFLVNIPVISQSSTAVAIGTVLVPLLRAGRVPAVTIGAALLLGSSIGGELLNPGAPEFQTIAKALNLDATTLAGRLVPYLFPLLMIHLAVASLLFWFLSVRADATELAQAESRTNEERKEQAAFRVNWVKALVPVLPVVLLFLTGPPLHLILPQEIREWLTVPKDWLTDAKTEGSYGSRLIGAAMLVGVVAASLTSWRTAPAATHAFFEGAGHAFARIIGIIVSASCFGAGVKLIGMAALLGQLIEAWPTLLLPAAGALPLAFGWVSGSGMAATQSLFEFFVRPASQAHTDPALVGAVVSLAAAAGRTLSPVSAVTLMSAALTETPPLALVRRIAVPLLAGLAVLVVAAMVMAAG